MPRSGGLTRAASPARLGGALASGLLFALTFPRPDLGWLVWIALVPLLVAIHPLRPGQAFRFGYLTGLVGFGLLLEWMRLFGLPVWIAMSAILALYTGAFAAGARLLAGGHAARGLWAIPLTWVAVEVVRSTGPIGFPWGLLGLTQYRVPSMLALASIGGVFGVSALIALVNATLATVVVTRRMGHGAAAAAVVVAAAALVGMVRAAPPVMRTHVVAAVQPNIDPLRKGDPSSSAAQIAGLLQQTAEARRAGAELIVYPETAVPIDLEAASDLRRAIAQSAGGATVVASALLPGPRNAVLVLDARGEIIGRYAKRRLVPFGEAGVQRGREAAPVGSPVGRLGPVICYESAFPFMVRALAADGADLIVLLTNDGWFGTSAGPAQHAAQSALRAAETGVSVIRAANTGTSTLIRPDGQIVGSLPLATSGVLVAALPVGGRATPYVRWGWVLGPLAVAIWLGVAAPMGFDFIRRRSAAVWRLAAALVIPGLVWYLGSRDDGGAAGPWAAALAVLAASVAIGRGHLLNPRGLLISGGLSLLLTGGLVAAMASSYARYGFLIPLGPPPDAWAAGRLIAAGVAVEVWLRGAVFAHAQKVGGWPLATATSTLAGMLLHLGATPEIMLWHLATGLVFSLLRLRTGDAVGLGPARGLGDAVVLTLAGLR